MFRQILNGYKLITSKTLDFGAPKHDSANTHRVNKLCEQLSSSLSMNLDNSGPLYGSQNSQKIEKNGSLEEIYEIFGLADLPVCKLHNK